MGKDDLHKDRPKKERPKPQGNRNHQRWKTGGQNPKLAQPEPNEYEHFFSATDKGRIGATGNHEQTAITIKEIRRVGGLAFDIDVKHFTPEMASKFRKYLLGVLPQLELRAESFQKNEIGAL